MKRLVVGFLGLGNIGSGLFRLIASSAAMVAEREDLEIVVKRALVRDVGKARNLGAAPPELTCAFADILNDDEITCVVEVLGGVEPAADYLEACLRAGKTVVTANKEALAHCGARLRKAAREGDAGLYFEASVCGGIPVIKTIRASLQSNDIYEVKGIINGTTNFILCRMEHDGMTYEEALSQAQALGLAEPDPAADVGGGDAACKLSILASLAFHSHVPLEQVFTRGIEGIDRRDIEQGRRLGYGIKLLAIAKKRAEGVEARVHPAFIPQKHPLNSVRDAYNAVYIEGNAVGNLMLYGQGAGDMPTASAMLSDIITAAQAGSGQPAMRKAHTEAHLPILDDWMTRYYLRVQARDMPGVLAKIAGALGRHGVSIANCVQNEAGGATVPIYVITHLTGEQAMQAAVEEIAALEEIEEVSALVRVED